MPTQVSYPGVYIEEVPSGVRTITGVATSITAFLGRAVRGPVNEATTITSYADFERTFGGLNSDSPMSFAVRDFFRNGGGNAVIVRLFHHDTTVPTTGPTKIATADVTVGSSGLLQASSPGTWGQHVRCVLDFRVSASDVQAAGLVETPWNIFNLTLRDSNSGTVQVHRRVTSTDGLRRIDRFLKSQSQFARWKGEYDEAKAEAFEQELEELFKNEIGESKTKLTTEETSLATAEAMPNGTSAEQDIRKVAILDANKSISLAKATIIEKLASTELRDAVSKAESELTAKRMTFEKALAKPETPAETPAEIDAARNAVSQASTAVEVALKARADLATDGAELKYGDFFPTGGEDKKTGLFALEQTDLFNLLCLPSSGDWTSDIWKSANIYCSRRRAMLIVDPPSTWRTDEGKLQLTFKSSPSVALSTDIGLDGPAARNAAIFFPRVRYPNPLKDGLIEEFSLSGTIAGIMARTDATRGVWKAPAGLDASLNGIHSLSVKLTDAENGILNPVGINCLRSFPASGNVVWGARTLRGDDQLGDEYKYIPVRRTALFIEETLYRGTQWVVFEPNDEPLWAQIRLNVGAFMHDLYRQGAFQGRTPREAFFVKCDKETTTQNDINRGIVNVVVGFAPLKPAEFVVIKLTQIAGQIEA